MKPLVSVIIPMYNVAATFDACIEHLRRQSYRPLELILLNDASQDATPQYMQALEARWSDPTIQLKCQYNTVNQGVAVMRNEGMRLASGHYLYAYDADDALAPTAIERLVDAAESLGADLVSCHWYLRYEGRDRLMNQALVSSGEELYSALCYGTMKWNVWLYLVRRTLIEEPTPLRYQPGDNMGEDMLMTLRLALRARRVAVVPEALYYYVKTNSQAQTASYRPEHWAQVDRNLKGLASWVTEQSPEAAPLLDFLKLNLKLPLLISTSQADYERWSQWYPEANHLALKNPALPLRTRLLQWLAAHQQWWLIRLYNRLVMQWLYKLLYK